MARNRRPPTKRHIRVHGGGGDDQWFEIPREVFDQYGDYLHNGDGRWQERLSIEPSAAKKALHEWASFIRLANNGHVVVVRKDEILKSNPDLILDGTLSEVKTPTGTSRNTVGHQVDEARKQAKVLIIDLFRSTIPFIEGRSAILKVPNGKLSQFNRIVLMSDQGIEEVIVGE